METIEVNELKQIQIDILNNVDDFCRKNNIHYWIDCGTLLGAVRHKGYIPWDDDIDIGMLRKDYEIFRKKFNKDNNSIYKFHCFENDKEWFLPYGKVLNENTILYEPDKKTGVKSSIYIDVFVYDNVPNDDKVISTMYKKRDLYKILNNLQTFKGFYTKNRSKYNIFRYPFHYLMKVFPKRYFVKLSIKNSKQFCSIPTKKIGNFTSVSKVICDKSIFDEFVDLEFEGKKYSAPKEYDKWLFEFYGDYMKLPPIENRVSHHRFEAYYK